MDKDLVRLRQLKPEEKVNIAIDMTDACVHICAEGIRAQYPQIAEDELLEKLRERTEYAKGRR
jgi:hypothetical protein